MISFSIYKPKLFILTVFVVLILGYTVLAQVVLPPSDSVDLGMGGGNAIVGSVFSPAGGRIETRVSVRLATMTRGDRTTTTDEKGNFSFRGLPPGSYTIRIEREKEYEPYSQEVDIIQLRGTPPQVYSLNIRLKLKPETDVKPEVINSELYGVPKKALKSYNKAVELAKSGNHRDAVKQLQISIALHPDFMIAFNELGVEYLRLEELEKADEAFRSALKINPDAFAPLMNRGIVLVHLKRYEEAKSVLSDALKIKEQSAVAHYFLGQALANLGLFEEAKKELNVAITLGGDEMRESHRLLAIICSAQGDKMCASKELETYLRLTPMAPDAEQLRKVIQNLKGLDEPK